MNEIKESNLDNKDRSYATGKRKNSIARVWLKKGEGKISVNGKSLNKYFSEISNYSRNLKIYWINFFDLFSI